MQLRSEDDLMVAVEMITFNHEKYIAQAIESVLNQNAKFKYKLIICEDCSTDNTAQICKTYKDQFPEIIDLHVNESNLGLQLNAEKLHSASFSSNSKYIAMLDGDDYWCDESKLQKQVDFLEANPDYSICFHRVYELENNKEPVLSNLNTSEHAETYTIEDLAKGNFIHTPSIVFRNGLMSLPEWFFDSPVGDYPIHMFNAKQGKIKYFPEPMAVYRRHSAGVWGKKSRVHQSEGWIWMLEHLNEEFSEYEVKKTLSRQKADIENELAYLYKSEGNNEKYYQLLYQSFQSSYDFFVDWIKKNAAERISKPSVVERFYKKLNRIIYNQHV